MYIKRDRFLGLLDRVLDFTNKTTVDCYIRIKEAINSYGKWYLYDRNTNIVSELTEDFDYEHIKPQDLFNETRKNMIDPDEQRFQGLNNQFRDVVNNFQKDTPGIFKKFFNRGWAVVRQIGKK